MKKTILVMMCLVCLYVRGGFVNLDTQQQVSTLPQAAIIGAVTVHNPSHEQLMSVGWRERVDYSVPAGYVLVSKSWIQDPSNPEKSVADPVLITQAESDAQVQAIHDAMLVRTADNRQESITDAFNNTDKDAIELQALGRMKSLALLAGVVKTDTPAQVLAKWEAYVADAGGDGVERDRRIRDETEFKIIYFIYLLVGNGP